ncbi:MAG TPA: 1,4-dihydroxy-2-naphthoate octaprenyltransferase [Anaerohalosphaeraceae bacterium]|nr:1,4-dihydroxy-2-naphthoate octaprenyltransferase [Anaerohalosphaeraceae bacterium]
MSPEPLKPTEMNRTRLSIWLQAFRPFSYTASIIPVFLGAALAYGNAETQWPLLPFVLAASLAIHAGTNLINEYFDFLKGVDRPDTRGGSRVLPEGLLSPGAVLAAGLICFALTALLGLWFIWLRGWPMLLLGLVGMAGGFFYTGFPFFLKYRGFGDPMVFVLMGPLMVIGSYYVLTGAYSHSVLWVSLPVGCLVAAILSANNLRDIEDDIKAGIQTTACLLGFRLAKLEYAALVLTAFGITAVLIVLNILPLLSLLVLLTAPLAFRNLHTVLTSRDSPELEALDRKTAALHLAFGILLILSILLNKTA